MEEEKIEMRKSDLKNFLLAGVGAYIEKEDPAYFIEKGADEIIDFFFETHIGDKNDRKRKNKNLE